MNQSSNQSQDLNKPEKDKVKIYDEDEAYMLNDDKDNAIDDELQHSGEGPKEFDQNDDINDLSQGQLGGEFDEELNNNRREHDNNEELDDNLMSAERESERNHEQNQIHNHNRYQNEHEHEDVTIQNNHPQNNNSQQKSAKKNERENSKSISNLVTLKYISVCQSCKENFNSSSNVPFLLKCGHFFCRSCLENHFTEEDGSIFCPDDGLVANNLNELKLLNNLIVERSVDNDEQAMSSNRANQTVKFFEINNF